MRGFVFKTVRQTTRSCPSQWKLEDAQGNHWYVRYRFGVLRAERNGDVVFGVSVGEPLDGTMRTETMLEILVHYLAKTETPGY